MAKSAVQALPAQPGLQTSGVKQNGSDGDKGLLSRRPTSAPLPELPTFPLEVGYREIYDPATNTVQQLPLTL
jgi:hypothetical protein